jgi:hypothetical protein
MKDSFDPHVFIPTILLEWTIYATMGSKQTSVRLEILMK